MLYSVEEKFIRKVTEGDLNCSSTVRPLGSGKVQEKSVCCSTATFALRTDVKVARLGP